MNNLFNIYKHFDLNYHLGGFHWADYLEVCELWSLTYNIMKFLYWSNNSETKKNRGL